MSLLSALVGQAKKLADPMVSDYAAGNREYSVRLLGPAGEASFNRATQEFIPAEEPMLFEGPARIWPVGSVTTVTSLDELASVSQIKVSIGPDTDRDPRMGDVLVVLDQAQDVDGNLAGRRFTVTDVETGGFFTYGWQLSATGEAPSRHTA